MQSLAINAIRLSVDLQGSQQAYGWIAGREYYNTKGCTNRIRSGWGNRRTSELRESAALGILPLWTSRNAQMN